MKRSLEPDHRVQWQDCPADVQRLCVLARPQPLWQAVSRQWYEWISAEQLPWWHLLPLPPWDDDAAWERIVRARAGPRSGDVPQEFLGHLHNRRCHMAVWGAPSAVMRHFAHYVWDLKPLACVNWHRRDWQATFTDRDHRYTIAMWDAHLRRYRLFTNEEGTPGAYISVTTFHKPLFEQFDAQRMSERCAGRGKYAGMDAEKVRALWDSNRDKSAGRGTVAHARNEDEMNGTVSLLRGDDAPVEITREFVRDHITPHGLRPFRSEWTLYSSTLRLVGQADALYEYTDPEKRKPDADGFVHLALLCDWKCAQKVERAPYKAGQCGNVPATSKVPDCEYERWCMQLQRYESLLMLYGYRVDAMCDVVIHPDPVPPRPAGEPRYQRLDVHKNIPLLQDLNRLRLSQLVVDEFVAYRPEYASRRPEEGAGGA